MNAIIVNYLCSVITGLAFVGLYNYFRHVFNRPKIEKLTDGQLETFVLNAMEAARIESNERFVGQSRIDITNAFKISIERNFLINMPHPRNKNLGDCIVRQLQFTSCEDMSVHIAFFRKLLIRKLPR